MSKEKPVSTYESFIRSPHFSTKHSSYFASYDRLFSRYVGRAVTFVEVGVLSGGSLFMWRDYLGPNARIIGVDLNPAAAKWRSDGFEIYVGDQSDPNFWKDFYSTVGEIDILLDDGGHTYKQQIETIESSLHMIRNGGVLVVEDTHTSYLRGFGPQKYSFIRYTCEMIHRINRRSSTLNSISFERRVWAIEIFESMVAFHIQRTESESASQLLANGREFDGAVDYRYASGKTARLWSSGRSLRDRYPALERIPGMGRLRLLLHKLRSAYESRDHKPPRSYFRQ